MALDVHERRHLLAGDLLLEQRAHHDRGGAGVLEPADGVEVVDQRGGADDQRMRQPSPR